MTDYKREKNTKIDTYCLMRIETGVFKLDFAIHICIDHIR